MKNTANKIMFCGFYEDAFLNVTMSNLNFKKDDIVILSTDENASVNFKNSINWESLLYPEILDLKPINSNDPISSIYIKKFASAFQFFSRSLDRVYINPLSQREVEKYFFTLLNYYESLFKTFDNKIKIIFFHTTPHFPQDIALFFFAKYHKIKTFF